jgi:hypothetical protein
MECQIQQKQLNAKRQNAERHNAEQQNAERQNAECGTMPNAKFYNLTFGILPYLAFCHIRHCVV